MNTTKERLQHALGQAGERSPAWVTSARKFNWLPTMLSRWLTIADCAISKSGISESTSTCDFALRETTLLHLKRLRTMHKMVALLVRSRNTFGVFSIRPPRQILRKYRLNSTKIYQRVVH